MRILFLTDNFPPETNAPASRTFEHAVRWVRAGHQVTVVTGAPNFPQGRVFPGYRNAPYAVEDMSGVRVVRVGTYITANEGFLKRTLDYVSFMITGLLGGLLQPKPDLVAATSPQFFCALGGWMLAKLRRVPFVFELRDLWPASIVAVGAMRPGLAVSLLERLELFLYRQASLIVSVTHAFKDELVARGVPADKIAVVLNGVDLERYAPRPRDEELAARLGLTGRFVIGYVGTHGLAHALHTVLDAAELLRHEPDVAFLLVGSGAQREALVAEAQRRNLPNVFFLPPQPKEAMPAVWSLCDVALVSLKDSPLFTTVIPSKIFEAMGMGLPLLLTIPEGEAAAIVREAGAGLTVEPEQPERLAQAALRLAREPELVESLAQASLVAARRYSRDAQAARMLDSLTAALAAEAPRPASQAAKGA